MKFINLNILKLIKVDNYVVGKAEVTAISGFFKKKEEVRVFYFKTEAGDSSTFDKVYWSTGFELMPSQIEYIENMWTYDLIKKETNEDTK